jgi:hypothetical protein
MRDRRIDRFVILPFSVGCVSQSSVAVVDTRSKKAQGDPSNNHSISLYNFALDIQVNCKESLNKFSSRLTYIQIPILSLYLSLESYMNNAGILKYACMLFQLHVFFLEQS